jgi:hypothetical protein
MLDIPAGMPLLFATARTSTSWHISFVRITHLRWHTLVALELYPVVDHTSTRGTRPPQTPTQLTKLGTVERKVPDDGDGVVAPTVALDQKTHGGHDAPATIAASRSPAPTPVAARARPGPRLRRTVR